jgi:hypothetical protein
VEASQRDWMQPIFQRLVGVTAVLTTLLPSSFTVMVYRGLLCRPFGTETLSP